MENMEKLKKCAEICLLGLLIVIVWLLFSIPTIVHFSPDEVSCKCTKPQMQERISVHCSSDCGSSFGIRPYKVNSGRFTSIVGAAGGPF